MRTSKVLTEILRHAWMMDLRAVNGYLPVVASWLLGQEIQFEERGPLQIQAATAARFTPDDIEDLQDSPDNTIAVIPLKREMLKYGGLSSYGTIEIGALAQYASRLKNISAVVLDVDSPGGSVNAIPPMLEGIKALQASGKPVVVHGDLVASAALYTAVHADYIFADNNLSSEFGSIGVMVQFADYKEYFEQKGVKIHEVYAEQSTHKNSEIRDAFDGNYETLKTNMLNPLAIKFQEAVKLNRGQKLLDSEPGLLNGRMFMGDDIVRTGLADKTGTMADAIEMAFSLAEVKRWMRR